MKKPKQVKKMVLNSDCVGGASSYDNYEPIRFLDIPLEAQMLERNSAYRFFDVGIEKDTDNKG